MAFLRNRGSREAQGRLGHGRELAISKDSSQNLYLALITFWTGKPGRMQARQNFESHTLSLWISFHKDGGPGKDKVWPVL